jgi:hypothetical protein
MTNPTHQRYDEIFSFVQKIVAHPHTTITAHDKHRAVILISFLNEDDELVEYIYSQLTQDECKLIKQMRKEISGKL